MKMLFNTISDFTSGERNRLTSYFARESLLLLASLVYPQFIFVCFIDSLVLLPSGLKYFVWAYIVIVAVLIYLRFRKKTSISDKTLLEGVQRKYLFLGDDLINASQLENSYDSLKERGMSEELSDAFIGGTLTKISKIPPDDIPTENLIGRLKSLGFVAILITAVFALKSPEIFTQSAPKLLFSSGEAEFSKYVSVFPGDSKVPRGSEVTVIVSGKFPGSPRLYARARNIAWENFPLIQSATEYISEKIGIVERTEYYVRWGEGRSRKYVLEPVDFPRVAKLRVKFHFPPYTMKESKEGESFGQVALIAGTRVEFSAESNRALKKAALIFSYGKKFPLSITGGNKISGEFIADKEGECWFELLADDGTTDPQPARYQVYVQKDAYPEIKVLSPNQNLITAQDSSIDVIYNASDDFGLLRAELVFYANGEQASAKRVRIKAFSKSETDFTGNYLWKISDTGVKPGEVLNYYVIVADNDTVSGPKESRSETYTLEIFSYDKEHAEIEKSLSEFREDLMGLLGDQTKVRNSLAPQPENVNGLVEAQKKVKENAEKISSDLKKLLDRMEVDPLINYQIYSEHKSMKESLDYLSKNQMNEAQNALSKKDFDSAGRNMDDVISSLEKMNLLAEDVLQYQRMQDLLNAGEKLSGLSSQLKDGLQQAPDMEKLAKMRDVLDKIDKLTKDVNEILKKMPQTLPEEFVNQPAVKKINTGEIQDAAESLRQALDAGNFEKALEQAKKLVEQLSSMLKAMQEAGGSVGFGGAEKETASDAQKGSEELSSIISEQDKIIAETQEIENLRQQAIAEQQEKILGDLVKVQKAAISKAERIPSIPAGAPGSFTQFRAQVSGQVNAVIPSMRDVLKEMESKRIVKSKEWLKTIIAGLNAAETYENDFVRKISTTQAADFVEISSATKFVNDTEKNILSVFEAPPEAQITPGQKNRSAGLASRQSGLKMRALELDKKIQDLSRKSASVTPEVSANIRSASKEMGKASDNLNRSSTGEALSNERKALEYLTKGQESLQNGMQSLEQMQGKMNKPMAGFTQGRQGSGGTSGVRTGHVALPGVEEYVPPKEFREELLKALKEKYPEKYSEIIKKYYKKLTE